MKKYVLIKEYPDSPELGTEIIKSHISISRSFLGNYDTYMIKGEEWFKLPNPENYPEFWQPVIEKDYEILTISLRRSDKPKITNVIGCGEDYIQSLLNCDGNKIHSIKRLSDSKIFTIGDNTNSGIIESFKQFENRIIVNFDCNKQPNLPMYLDASGKLLLKVKQKLFTSEDGVDIFEDDTFYYVKFKENKNTYGKIFEIVTCSRPGCIYEPQFEKYFSTKEKAEEYVINNKPCLSLKEIYDLFPGYVHSSSTLIPKLKKLVKTKLNNKN